jgi:hypothetical protein
MILSVHIADVGLRASRAILRSCPAPEETPGLRYAETTIAAPLGGRVPVPMPQLGRAGLIASWDDDLAFERFLSDHPLAERLASGWHVRLQPLRAYGTWSGLPDLPGKELSVGDDEPVAVLTLGRLRIGRVGSFLLTSARAERQAVADPAVLASTGLARPPGLVATFSLWRTARAMRDYAHGASGDGHTRAIRVHRARPFHHESVFARFRPYAAHGTWDGREPLATVSLAAAPEPAA